MLEYHDADILAFPAQFIVHQFHCQKEGAGAKGLAARIFGQWPHAHPKDRQREPGSIDVFSATETCPGIINLYAQRGYAKANKKEPAEWRIAWFRKCLEEMKTLKATSLAFPYKIGCGMGGGCWDDYENALLEFAAETQTKVSICRLPLRQKRKDAAASCPEAKRRKSERRG